jgi:hypothetical protein
VGFSNTASVVQEVLDFSQKHHLDDKYLTQVSDSEASGGALYYCHLLFYDMCGFERVYVATVMTNVFQKITIA